VDENGNPGAWVLLAVIAGALALFLVVDVLLEALR
jgi:hypothetical protein